MTREWKPPPVATSSRGPAESEADIDPSVLADQLLANPRLMSSRLVKRVVAALRTDLGRLMDMTGDPLAVLDAVVEDMRAQRDQCAEKAQAWRRSRAAGIVLDETASNEPPGTLELMMRALDVAIEETQHRKACLLAFRNPPRPKLPLWELGSPAEAMAAFERAEQKVLELEARADAERERAEREAQQHERTTADDSDD